MKRSGTVAGLLRPFCAALLLALLLLPACTPAQPPRYTVFAMEGPPLAIVGGRLDDAGEPRLFGQMDRAGMVGNGEISLAYPPEGLVCQGSLKDGPARNGRVRGIIPCSYTDPAASGQTVQAVFLLLTLGQHGPDQGAGVARFARARLSGSANQADSGMGQQAEIEELEISQEPPLMFFYHPWDEEAARRYQDARENVLRGLEKRDRPEQSAN